MSKTTPAAVALNILDKEYKIACEKDEQAALIHSAKLLDQQMRKIRDTGKVIGADRIAVLAALNLAHDLSTLAGKGLVGTTEIDERLAAMRHKIENVLETL